MDLPTSDTHRKEYGVVSSQISNVRSDPTANQLQQQKTKSDKSQYSQSQSTMIPPSTKSPIKHKKDPVKKSTTVACLSCRQKKVKCSGSRPACTTCLRMNVECQYPALRNRGSRFGYLEMMKRRMLYMERCLGGKKLNEIKLKSQTQANTHTIRKAPIDIMRDMPMPVANVVTSAPRLYSNVDLPPEELVLHLVDLYFSHVHGQTYNFLHKQSFVQRVKTGQVNPTLLFALCALTARYSTHPMILAKNPVPYEAGENFIAAARNSMAEEFDDPNLETVQAGIIIVQHDFFRNQGKRSMIYVSLVLRMAATLELNQEPPQNLSFQERECRRRTYWSLVMMDRLAHAGPAWTWHIRTDVLKLRLPCKEYNYENNIPVEVESLNEKWPVIKNEKGLYAYVVIAIMLWYDVNKYALEGFKLEQIPPWKEGSEYRRLESRLQQIYTSLPREFHYTRANLHALNAINQGCTLVHLHCELLMSFCYLSRTIYPYSQDRFTELPSKEFIDRCAVNIQASANSLTAILNDVMELESIHLAPFIAFCVFSMTSVHIANCFSSDPEVSQRGNEYLSTNLTLLTKMREYWFSVGVWCNILKERYIECARTQNVDPAKFQIVEYAPQDFLKKQKEEDKVRNMLPDLSGPWFDSLELTDFTGFASINDLNNPEYWFETELKVQMEENQAIARTVEQQTGKIVQKPGNSLLDDKNFVGESVTEGVDKTLFQQSLLHQPFDHNLSE